MRDRTRCVAAALAALLAAPSAARAGGLARPNFGGSVRGMGWGNAFTAVADDPAALHHNPAGMATQYQDSVMLGVELVLAPRRYTPVIEDPATGQAVRGEDQKNQNSPIELPTLGYVTRLSEGGVPSRLALGVGFWSTFGGDVSYDKGMENVRAINSTRIAALEIVPGVAYEVNDFLQIGAALRLGLGLFSVDAEAQPVDSDLSAFGIGGGLTLGIMVAPSKRLRFGATWRSALTINTKGSGWIAPGGAMTDVTPKLTQEWPQQASIGVLWRPTAKLGLSAQLDWTDWSRMQRLVIDFEEAPTATQTFELDFHDNWAVHVGGQYTVTESLELRAGFTFDSNAVPDHTIERQYLDSEKYGYAVGVSYAFTRSWRLDSAVEIFAGGPVRHVPDNTKEYMDAGWPANDWANPAPGEHHGQVYTLDLAVQYKY
jgi:long-chain fatty acid transport protein